MTVHEYKNAIGRFEPDSFMKCRIAAGMKGAARKRRPSHRALTGVLVATAVLVCTMTAAFAASPELRHTVLSFFHLEAVEQVPGPEDMAAAFPDVPVVIQSSVDGQVKAQYIQWEYADAYYGRVKLEEDGDGHVFRLWDAENGVMSEQKIEAQESAFAVTWRGADYQGVIFWCVQDGEIFLSGGGADSSGETEWYVSHISGRTDAALLYVSQGRQLDYAQYAFLYHLDTGEVEDILAGTGAENLEQVGSIDWADNLSKALVFCCQENTSDRTVYYCDLTAGTLTDIRELTGLEVNSAFFADGETLIASSFTDTECSCWAYDLTTGQAVQILDRAHLYHQYEEEPYGILFCGARYGVYVMQSGETSVLDFKTGEQAPVESFTFSRDGSFLSNPSNTKLLYWVADHTMSSLGVCELGVLDLEKGVLISFDRAGYDSLYEHSIGWFDDDRVAIQAHTQDGETQYLYLYQFDR